MYCYNCGKAISDNSYACPYCGTIVVKAENNQPRQETQYQEYREAQNQTYDGSAYYAPPKPVEKRCWTVFARLGYIFGLIGFICSFIPLIQLFTLPLAEAGIVFSALGKKSSSLKERADKGLGFAIAGTILSVVLFIVFYVMFVIGIIASATYS